MFTINLICRISSLKWRRFGLSEETKTCMMTKWICIKSRKKLFGRKPTIVAEKKSDISNLWIILNRFCVVPEALIIVNVRYN